jgi:tetratricopeptide (TPR) repeat protein
MDLYFQGLAWFNKGFGPETMAKAHDFFDRSLSLDPNNPDVLCASARVDTYAASSLGGDIAAAYEKAETKYLKALSVAPDHARAHLGLGSVYIFSKRAAHGIPECEHAVALDRNSAQAHAVIGMAKTLTGRPQEADAHIREALRLSPRDVLAYLWHHWEGVANICLGRWEAAVISYRRSIEVNRTFHTAHFLLAASLARLDRCDEARASIKSGLAFNPVVTVSRCRALWTPFSDDAAYLAALEPVFEVLAKIGLPE